MAWGGNATRHTCQSIRQIARGVAPDSRRAADDGSRPVDAGMFELQFRRYRLPVHRAVEQRSAGMAIDRDVRAAAPLQRMQRAVRDCVAGDELRGVGRDDANNRHCEEHLRRSNPFLLCAGNMDCFASLAMLGDKSPLPIFGNRVKRKICRNRKYFCFPEPQITATYHPSRPGQRGVS